jgi:hypothetical protein
MYRQLFSLPKSSTFNRDFKATKSIKEAYERGLLSPPSYKSRARVKNNLKGGGNWLRDMLKVQLFTLSFKK